MTKKKGQHIYQDEDTYRIKSEAVDDLVNATKENTPEYSEEELKKYTTPHKHKLNPTFKALFVKFWFSAVVCYFLIWGLGMYIPSNLDFFVITSIAMGFVKDILENNTLRFMAKSEGENDKWMMFPKKKYSSLIFNVLFAFVVLFFVFTTYTVINLAILKLRGDEKQVVVFGSEPIFFGLFYMGYELLFIKMKHVAKSIVKDAEKNVKGGAQNGVS